MEVDVADDRDHVALDEICVALRRRGPNVGPVALQPVAHPLGHSWGRRERVLAPVEFGQPCGEGPFCLFSGVAGRHPLASAPPGRRVGAEVKDRHVDRRQGDRRLGDRRAVITADLAPLERRLDELGDLPPGAQAEIDQLTAALRDQMGAMGVDTTDRRRLADVAFGVQLVAEVVDRAMLDHDVDGDDGVVSGAMETALRALRALVRQ